MDKNGYIYRYIYPCTPVGRIRHQDSISTKNHDFLRIFESWRAQIFFLGSQIGLETSEIESPGFLDELKKKSDRKKIILLVEKNHRKKNLIFFSKMLTFSEKKLILSENQNVDFFQKTSKKKFGPKKVFFFKMIFFRRDFFFDRIFF